MTTAADDATARLGGGARPPARGKFSDVRSIAFAVYCRSEKNENNVSFPDPGTKVLNADLVPSGPEAHTHRGSTAQSEQGLAE